MSMRNQYSFSSSQDTGAEDVLGGSELLHRRMKDSLSAWQRAPWLLPFCSNAAATKNLYTLKAARVAASHSTGGLHGLDLAQPVFDLCNLSGSGSPAKAKSLSLSTSMFERHALQLQADQDFALRLEESGEETLLGEDSSASSSSKVSKHLITSAFAGVKKMAPLAGTGAGTGAGSGAAGSFGSLSEQREADLMGKSLADVIAEISSDLDGGNKGKAKSKDGSGGSTEEEGGGGRGTRFTHSTEFAQENISAKGIGSVTAPVTVAVSSAAGGSDKSTTPGGTTTVPQEGMTAKEKSALAAQAKQEAKKAAADEEERVLLEELEALREQVRRAESKVEGMERSQHNTADKSRHLENAVNALQQEGEALEKEIILKRKTLEMLPSAADNIGKLQTICANSAKRLMTLAQEWESHRRPLLEKYRDLKSSKTRRRDKCRGMVDDMKRCREEMVAMVQDLRDKQEKSTQLVEEVKKLPRNINRTLYTYRIMDIITSIGKQNKDIVKITGDIRDVQKTINQSSNTLQRADAICEDTIYMAANSAASTQPMIDSYRNLVKIRANFDNLITTVNKIGQLDNQTSELETKVDQELSRVSANNFDRIRSDLAEVQGDNNRLIAQLKALRK